MDREKLAQATEAYLNKNVYAPALLVELNTKLAAAGLPEISTKEELVEAIKIAGQLRDVVDQGDTEKTASDESETRALDFAKAAASDKDLLQAIKDLTAEG